MCCLPYFVAALLLAENNPQFAAWGDVLFYSAVGTLYRAAQLDAVASVAEAWGDTAIRLALYLSPLVSPLMLATLSITSCDAGPAETCSLSSGCVWHRLCVPCLNRGLSG